MKINNKHKLIYIHFFTKINDLDHRNSIHYFFYFILLIALLRSLWAAWFAWRYVHDDSYLLSTQTEYNFNDLKKIKKKIDNKTETKLTILENKMMMSQYQRSVKNRNKTNNNVLYICLSVCLCFCVSVHLSVCLSVCVSMCKKSK